MGLFDFLKRKELFEIESLKKQIQDLSKYQGIVDTDNIIEKKLNEFQTKSSELQKQIEELEKKYKQGYETYNILQKEIDIYNENIEMAEFGIYEPHFDFDTSEKYKESILNVREKQKCLIKAKKAVLGGDDISWNGSLSQGRSMVEREKKLMLRAFNGECDSFISNVSWNNVIKMKERINKSFQAINKVYEAQGVYIDRRFLELKYEELNLAFEYKDKKNKEKEEQRAIREQMREEEKARKEIESAIAKAQKEEEAYQNALEKARKEIQSLVGDNQIKMQKKIEELEARIAEAENNKQRAISMAQQTKRGHVYVISNIGSFGENVYKIGMTRRLDPMDRVRELGDASVPFSFDVHAIIFSEDAPALETQLHKAFEKNRINKINTKKEFFRVSLSEIESEVHKNNAEIEFIKTPEARDYRESKFLEKKYDDDDKKENIKFSPTLFE